MWILFSFIDGSFLIFAHKRDIVVNGTVNPCFNEFIFWLWTSIGKWFANYGLSREYKKKTDNIAFFPFSWT